MIRVILLALLMLIVFAVHGVNVLKGPLEMIYWATSVMAIYLACFLIAKAYKAAYKNVKANKSQSGPVQSEVSTAKNPPYEYHDMVPTDRTKIGMMITLFE